MSKLKAKAPEITEQGHIKMLVYGPTGVGKTWLTLAFPGLYYIAPESGAEQNHYKQRLLDAKGVYLGPDDGTLDPEFLIGQMQALATEKHDHKTLAVDSITKIYQTIIAQEAERLGDKDAFGASKKPAVSFMRRLVNWTSRLDMNCLFIAHESTEYGLVGGQRQEIGKQADVWDKLAYELDLVIQAIKQGPSRIAIVRKSRLIGFPEGDRFPLEYAEFASRFGKGAIEAKPKLITLATSEEVAEVNRLLGILKTEPDEIQKWLTKAKAESFAEMSQEQILKVTAFLTTKINK